MWADEFNPLVDWWDSHRHGLLTMKFTHYFDIYHRHLQHFRGKKAHLLEIGVASGGSLQMWKAGAEVLHLKDHCDVQFHQNFNNMPPLPVKHLYPGLVHLVFGITMRSR